MQKGKQNEKVYKNHDRIHEPHDSGSCERICRTGSLLYFDVLCALFDASASTGNVCLYYKRYGSGDSFANYAWMREDFRSFLFSIIQEVYDKSTAIVPISAVFTLWSAGKGLQGLTNGVNAIYHVKETRNYVVTRIRSALYTLIFILAVISSLILLVFGNSIQKLLTKYIPTLAKVTAYVIGMRTAVSLVVLALIFLMIYKFLPNRKTSFRSQIPGAVVSAVAWSLFSLGFSVYLDYYDGFSNMYGSLTTIILVLLWLYFCMYIVLIGAEINAYFEERLRRLHQMASELIRSEYQGLLKGIRENDTEEKKMTDKETTEKKEL